MQQCGFIRHARITPWYDADADTDTDATGSATAKSYYEHYCRQGPPRRAP